MFKFDYAKAQPILLKGKIGTLVLLFILAIDINAISQTKDSLDSSKSFKSQKVKKPSSAVLWGLIPGGGQVYNERYWKLPIVYGALGGLYYFTEYNRNYYLEFKTYFENKVTGGFVPSPYDRLSKEQLFNYKQIFRKDMERSYILLAFGYLLSIAEAFTDAHLSSFDVSDNITFSPSLSTPNSVGIFIKLGK